MQRVLFRPTKQNLVEFIEIEEPSQGRHFLCVSGNGFLFNLATIPDVNLISFDSSLIMGLCLFLHDNYNFIFNIYLMIYCSTCNVFCCREYKILFQFTIK